MSLLKKLKGHKAMDDWQQVRHIQKENAAPQASNNLNIVSPLSVGLHALGFLEYTETPAFLSQTWKPQQAAERREKSGYDFSNSKARWS